jgi:hypothetical protein
MLTSENRENLIGIDANRLVNVRQGIPQVKSVTLPYFDQRFLICFVAVVIENDVRKRGLDRVEKSIG